MEHKKYSPKSILKIVCGVAFAFWLMMGAPTGWIYDLGVGTGTEQGQMPDQSVSVIHTQDDVEGFFFQTTPATVPKESLIRCPLLRLRDSEYAGEHTHLNGQTKRTVVISEYIPVAYPTGPIRSFLLRFLASGHYNGYYLAPLEDGSYVCVYFDDYLMLRSGDELPTGYIRYTTTEEKAMLHQMAEDYELDPGICAGYVPPWQGQLDAGLCDPRWRWYSPAGGWLGHCWGHQKGCTEQRAEYL